MRIVIPVDRPRRYEPMGNSLVHNRRSDPVLSAWPEPVPRRTPRLAPYRPRPLSAAELITTIAGGLPLST